MRVISENSEWREKMEAKAKNFLKFRLNLRGNISIDVQNDTYSVNVPIDVQNGLYSVNVPIDVQNGLYPLQQICRTGQKMSSG